MSVLKPLSPERRLYIEQTMELIDGLGPSREPKADEFIRELLADSRYWQSERDRLKAELAVVPQVQWWMCEACGVVSAFIPTDGETHCGRPIVKATILGVNAVRDRLKARLEEAERLLRFLCTSAQHSEMQRAAELYFANRGKEAES